MGRKFIYGKSRMIEERKGGRRESRRPHGEEMKDKLLRAVCLMAVSLAVLVMSGCSVSFSDGVSGVMGEEGETNTETVIPDGALIAEDGNEIKIGEITLTLPEGMKYGIQETDVGNTYYVWKTERNYVFPTDTDIILYIYSGNDMTSPDSELSDSEARNSIQTYMQAFRTEVDGSISVDAGIASNNRWYVLQLTGNSGEYLQTTYGTLCYPKSYYGVYTMQKMTDSYTRDYYGFIFSNDSAGAIIEENEYNNIFGQIKSAFSITEFYTMPQVIYDETTDYSSGYSYKQLCTLFADTANYYGMSSVKNMDAGTENEMETEIDTERSNDYE